MGTRLNAAYAPDRPRPSALIESAPIAAGSWLENYQMASELLAWTLWQLQTQAETTPRKVLAEMLAEAESRLSNRAAAWHTHLTALVGPGDV